MQNAEVKMPEGYAGMMNDEKDLGPPTKLFARSIIRMFTKLSMDSAAQILGRQVLRSGTSVGANYREARRGRSKAEFIAKIGDCLKEADETLYWLELLAEEGFLPPTESKPLIKEADELVAIFITISRRSRGDD
jgi:four helix bundle protein